MYSLTSTSTGSGTDSGKGDGKGDGQSGKSGKNATEFWQWSLINTANTFILIIMSMYIVIICDFMWFVSREVERYVGSVSNQRD